MIDFVQIAKMYGPFAAAVAFFMWRDWQREKSMSIRINAVEDYVKDSLTGLIEKTVKSINDQTASNREMCATLNRRPCLKMETLTEGK